MKTSLISALFLSILYYCSSVQLKTRTEWEGEFTPYSASESFEVFKNEWVLPQRGQGRVKFQAKFISNDVKDLHVGFSPIFGMQNPMYQLVFGGWSNTRSVLRNRVLGDEICGNKFSKIPDAEWHEWWIDVDNTTKSIFAWIDGQLFFSCSDAKFQGQVKFFSIIGCCGGKPLIRNVSVEILQGYANLLQ